MAKKKDYIKTGICIWCGKKKPYVSFNTAPHIIPKSLGGTEIGVDVCDDCNSYFGTPTKDFYSTNVVLKELYMASSVFHIKGVAKKKRFETAFFQFNTEKYRIKEKRHLDMNKLTKSFKRALYELFLQKYHTIFNDALTSKFYYIRQFARYGKGNLKVYYIYNNIILREQKPYCVNLHFSRSALKDLFEYGFYHFWFAGHILILEIFPFLASSQRKKQYLQKIAKTFIIGAKGDECMFELTHISQMDPFYLRLHTFA